MNVRSGLVLSAVLSFSLFPAAAAAQGLLITEFMANNTKTLADEEGEFPDWVEIFNAGESPANLDGFHLTDDGNNLSKWTFPAVTLGPGQFLLVFCSENDRRDPASELHTNFRLEELGESLALVAPDGRTVVSAFDTFPEQQADISFGLSTDSTSTKLVATGALVRSLIPPNGDLGLTWTETNFDDAAWRQGTTAVGFGVPQPDADLIGLDIGAEMVNINASAYLRIPFDVPDTNAVDVMRLRVRYDDGFVAFLNGRLVASGAAPGELMWNSRATRGHSQQAWEEIDLSHQTDALRQGKNVLAVQALNGTLANSDLFFLPEIEAINVGSVRPGAFLFFERPSPRAPNGAGLSQAAPRPQISLAEGTYVDTQTVEIHSGVAGSVIRYTLDGTLPTESSTAYTGAVQIAGPTRLAARVFKDGLLPSPPDRRTFVIISPNLVNFSSNLPLVVCVTFGRPMGSNCGGGPYTSGHITVIAPGSDGRANLVEEPHVSHLAAFRRRGSSTCGNAKFAFNVEMQDADGEDENVELLDFPVESDYIMYAPNNFDRALIRNPIAYWMSREVGRWAARTRNVECYFHTGTGPVTTTSYVGVYNLMEKNKRHPLKVDIQQISSRDVQGAAVTGGYLFRRDRVGPDEIAISGGGYGSLVFVYPKLPVPAQRAYMTSFVNQVISSLNSNIGKQEDNQLIDFTAWLDHHIINWYTKNVDAFRLSGYFYKDRDGPLVMGPVWDFDRTMGCSDDDRAADPLGFNNNASGDGGTRYFEAGGLGSWYSILFQNQPPVSDTPWNTAYRDRWRELRRGPLRTDRILAQVDFYAEELKEAAVRDTAKWPGLRGRFGGFQGEIDHLKNWLATRADWIDTQFIEKPHFSHPGGIVERGLQVEILMTAQAVIHYTINGTDPRGPNSQPSVSAVRYTGPITIDQNTRVLARALYPDGLWSGSAEAKFVVDVPRLMITEVMYSPLAPTPEEDPVGEFRSATRMEFVELTNVGTTPIPLAGMRFSKGITYTLPSEAGILAAGESIVVASNVRAFAARYGSEGIRVIGPFVGTLSDSGEALALVGLFDETLFDFVYSNDWYPTTAGQGASLVNVDPLASPVGLGDAARWMASAELNGNPGRADLGGGSSFQLPGDATGDGKLNVSDAVGTLRLLVGGSTDGPCGDGGLETNGNRTILDWDGNNELNVTDAVGTLRYLFLGGEPHAAGTACISVPGCVDACGR